MAKVEILHIWDADGDHWITAHASKKERDLSLYEFAMDHWDGYEDLPDAEGLSQSEAVEMWTEAANDYYWYEFSTCEVKDLSAKSPEPDDAVFLTERELLVARKALERVSLPNLCEALGDADCQNIKQVAHEVDEIHEKLKL